MWIRMTAHIDSYDESAQRGKGSLQMRMRSRITQSKISGIQAIEIVQRMMNYGDSNANPKLPLAFYIRKEAENFYKVKNE